MNLSFDSCSLLKNVLLWYSEVCSLFLLTDSRQLCNTLGGGGGFKLKLFAWSLLKKTLLQISTHNPTNVTDPQFNLGFDQNLDLELVTNPDSILSLLLSSNTSPPPVLIELTIPLIPSALEMKKTFDKSYFSNFAGSVIQEIPEVLKIRHQRLMQVPYKNSPRALRLSFSCIKYSFFHKLYFYVTDVYCNYFNFITHLYLFFIYIVLICLRRARQLSAQWSSSLKTLSSR